MTTHITTLGFVWYKRESYKAIKSIMEDADELPTTYDKWLYAAEQGLEKAKRAGHLTVRVHIDPQTFPAWCADHGYKPNAEGRTAFANVAANARYQEGSG